MRFAYTSDIFYTVLSKTITCLSLFDCKKYNSLKIQFTEAVIRKQLNWDFKPEKRSTMCRRFTTSYVFIVERRGVSIFSVLK